MVSSRSPTIEYQYLFKGALPLGSLKSPPSSPVSSPTIIPPTDVFPVSAPTAAFPDYARATSLVEEKDREDFRLFKKFKVSCLYVFGFIFIKVTND